MKAQYALFLIVATGATAAIFYYFPSPFVAFPFLGFGFYCFNLKCPCCWQRTIRRGLFYLPWIPHDCEKCGYVYD
jgi:hypothetical protein